MPVSGGTGIVWGVDLFWGVLCGVCASGWLLPMLPPSSGLRARQHDASSGSACAKRGRGRCIQHSCWQPTNCPPWALLETALSQVVTGCHGDQPQHLLTLPLNSGLWFVVTPCSGCSCGSQHIFRLVWSISSHRWPRCVCGVCMDLFWSAAIQHLWISVLTV